LAQHRSARSPATGSPTRARVRVEPSAAEITDVIPFNEFGSLQDVNFRPDAAFNTDAQVLHAPELDDLHHADNLRPLWLLVPDDRYADNSVRTNDLYADVAYTRVRGGSTASPPSAPPGAD